MSDPLRTLPGIYPSIPADEDVGDILDRAARALASQPPTDSPRWVARAPACIDLAGGIAEYSGAAILSTPLADAVNVTVQLRDDRKISFHGLEEFEHNPPFQMELDEIASSSPKSLRSATTGIPWLMSALGAAYAMTKTGKLNGAQQGANIVVESALPFLTDAGMGCAATVAVISAISNAWSLRCEPVECAKLAMISANEVVGAPCGSAAALSTLYAREGCVSQICMNSWESTETIPIPEGIVFLAVHCGVKHENAREKYARARTAAFMGRLLIDRLYAASGHPAEHWKGSLGGIPIHEYVKSLRDRVPTKMKGADFIERFGDDVDPLTRVDPSATYKIRSRTEHHIYEADRARKFADSFGLAARGINRDRLIHAGEYMYASHWSYGQRCGIGSVETDRLVSEIRDQEGDSGIYGAKISGEGSGGIVVVMMEDNDKARSALNNAIARYETAHGKNTSVYEGSSKGLMEFGVHQTRA
jgi:galactokinase